MIHGAMMAVISNESFSDKISQLLNANGICLKDVGVEDAGFLADSITQIDEQNEFDMSC